MSSTPCYYWSLLNNKGAIWKEWRYSGTTVLRIWVDPSIPCTLSQILHLSISQNLFSDSSCTPRQIIDNVSKWYWWWSPLKRFYSAHPREQYGKAGLKGIYTVYQEKCYKIIFAKLQMKPVNVQDSRTITFGIVISIGRKLFASFPDKVYKLACNFRALN